METTPESGAGDGAGADGGSASGLGFAPTSRVRSWTRILTPSAPQEDPQIVSWAQSCLAHVVGGWVPQDGNLGNLTRRAIQMFQTQAQLPSNGTLDVNTLSALQHACEAPTAAPPFSEPDAGASPRSPCSLQETQPALLLHRLVRPGTATENKEMPYWSYEYQEMENEDHPGMRSRQAPPQRVCELDRCTNLYLRWVQTALNQIFFAQRLKVTGILDDRNDCGHRPIQTSEKAWESPQSYHTSVPLLRTPCLLQGLRRRQPCLRLSAQ